MNKALLEYEMKKRQVSIEDLCSFLGISRSSYYRKSSGQTEFTLSEIKKIIEYLQLDTPVGIFFAEEVS